MKPVLSGIAMLLVLSGCVVVVDTADGKLTRELNLDRDWSVKGAREIVFKAHGRVVVTQGSEDRVTIDAPVRLYGALRVLQAGNVVTISGPAVLDSAYAEEIDVHVTLRNPERVTLRGRGIVEMAPVDVASLHLALDGQGQIDASRVTGGALTVSIRGHGDVHVANVAVERLAIDLSGHGNVLLDEVTAQRVDAGISGHGNVRVTGSAEVQRLRLAGHGDWDAADLRTRDASLAINGRGTAEVWVERHLTVDAARYGLVHYRGSPALDVRGGDPVHQVRTSAVAADATALASLR